MSEFADHLLPPELIESARQVIEANRARGKRIAVAESCTGGLVSAALTEIAGSSDVFEAGIVTYSNEAKMALVGVSIDVLDTCGAVSVATAWARAQGALARTGADTAVAITGIAGPGGGTADKPVGLVHFAGANRGGRIIARERRFGDLGRAEIRRRSVLEALAILKELAEAPG